MNQMINGQDFIQVTNYGGFIGEFYITYIQNGSQPSVDSGPILVGQTRRIYISPGTTVIFLKLVVYLLGVTIPLINDTVGVQTYCFGLYGTMFNPSYDDIPCNSLGNSNSQCCSCCRCWKHCNRC